MGTRSSMCRVVVLWCALLFLSGCNSLKNTMDARNSMDVFSHVPAPIDKVWPAVVEVSKEMGLVIVYQTFDGKEGWIKGFSQRLDHVLVYVYRADTESTSLCIQARTKYVSSAPPEYTDYAFAEALVREVKARTAPSSKSP